MCDKPFKSPWRDKNAKAEFFLNKTKLKRKEGSELNREGEKDLCGFRVEIFVWVCM